MIVERVRGRGNNSVGSLKGWFWFLFVKTGKEKPVRRLRTDIILPTPALLPRKVAPSRFPSKDAKESISSNRDYEEEV